MKLMQAVRAHLAAEEMGRQTLPYDLALALVKVKKATKDDTAFFIEKERELVMEYAALDEQGHVRLTAAGTFVFKDPARGGEYEAARQELGNTDIGLQPVLLRVKAPAQIKPEHIEALEGFVDFITEEARM